MLANMLEALGFDIAGAEATVEALDAAITESVGVDLVVVRKPTVEQTIDTISALRLIPKTMASPILVQAGAIDKIDLDGEYRGDRRVLIGRAGLGEPQMQAQIEGLLDEAVGGMMSEAEAEAYAIDALSALEDIAISGSPAYDIADAESSLIDALAERTGGVRDLVAKILSMIGSERAQQSLWETAMSSTGNEQISMLDHLADSVKRFGSHAQAHQVDGLIDLIRSIRRCDGRGCVPRPRCAQHADDGCRSHADSGRGLIAPGRRSGPGSGGRCGLRGGRPSGGSAYRARTRRTKSAAASPRRRAAAAPHAIQTSPRMVAMRAVIRRVHRPCRADLRQRPERRRVALARR